MLHPEARVPARGRVGDAAYDLACVEPVTLAPGERALVGTGVAVAIPAGLCGLVLPRSGLAIKHGIACVNAPGLIDPNYRGEVKVILINHGEEPWSAAAGDRIAQLLLVAFAAPELTVVDTLPDSERGAGGFGSSGR
ncbi:dUTP diphosphatase [Solirubrobacter phytolaccae]|uniref:dUTP diphosphatase n=1 Tax=Solirubrobacter phytolaccae TaxID=1404360 RepID=A0A9X3N998_9ACTN|nr:dUTP diphosphatase [Solirubrobacter phytolaccae]MDA0182143.1 dUTP diphosphatase [Solirubrobacter phytolaccae]